MEYEWNENKRKETMRDRGVDFADAARIDWDAAITVEDQRGDYGETI
ncbi:MAG: hypothetical protein CNE91_04050 [SAR116 cluster bacterium MED-G04]|nr:MAG: hypothetical protein CNE91_04050 [SAR116 cluster bacterium MED-G04]